MACETVCRIVDPRKPQVLTLQVRPDSVATSCSQRHVILFDNISSMERKFSDLLCGICTGSAFPVRTHYTHAEETCIPIHNPLVLNGIPDFITQPDLASRAFGMNLAPVRNYIPEHQLRESFEQAHPEILGGLLTVFTTALSFLNNYVPAKDRLASTSQLMQAAEETLGYEPGSYDQWRKQNQKGLSALAVDGSQLAFEILHMDFFKSTFLGTYQELYDALQDSMECRGIFPNQYFPQSSKALGNKLKELAPALEDMGMTVAVKPRSSTTGAHRIELTWPSAIDYDQSKLNA